jgi:hypothetical protein
MHPRINVGFRSGCSIETRTETIEKKLGFKEGINCDSRRLIRPQKKPMIFTLLEKLAGSVKISFENVAADTSDWIKK